jgi:single-strand DNA-binding protein
MVNVVTLDGNLVRDPELRFTGNGHPVVNVTVAHTPRSFNKATSEWEDGETLFLPGSLWREAAENAAETLRQGMAVVVTGELKQRSYEKDGEKRTVIEMDIKNIGPSLLRAQAEVTKNPPKNGKPSESRQAGPKKAAEEPAEDEESPF